MLFKISLKNVKKSFKDYAIYFLTLILGVAIFYVFNAIESQTVLLKVASSTYAIIDLMITILSGVSVFVSFVLGFLIIYASRFLIKRRNKEFGIYLTLGMGKRKISLILFFETLFIGILSLIIGLGLGFVISQFMSLFVANMFEADMSKFTFVFSSKACIKTLIYFTIMYLLVMLFNTYNISRCKLIDLLHASKKTEKIRMKNPFISTIVFLVAICLLGYAYYSVTGNVHNLGTPEKILKPIVCGGIATVLIFWSLSGLLINIFTKIKKYYFKGLNSFTLRQFSSKINTTVLSTSIICIMLFITICVLSCSFAIKNAMSSNIKELAPADLQISKRINLDNSWLKKGYTQEQIDNSNLSILETLSKYDIDLDSELKEYVKINIYNVPKYNLYYTLGTKQEDIKLKYGFLDYDTPEKIIKISDYNKVADLYGKDKFELNDDEYMIIADYESMVEIRNIALSNKEKLVLFDKELKPKYTECQYGFIEMGSNHFNSGIIIVPDKIVNSNYLAFEYLIGNYNTNNKQTISIIDNKLMKINDQISSKHILPSIETKLHIANNSVGLGALATFIGLYVGIIFLISSAAIIALKELSESTDNKERYSILRKIGTDEKMINKALFRQIGIFFVLPLLLAILHSIFGIKFSLVLLNAFGTQKLLVSILITSVIILFIYGSYFLLTYLCSKNIIKERK